MSTNRRLITLVCARCKAVQHIMNYPLDRIWECRKCGSDDMEVRPTA